MNGVWFDNKHSYTDFRLVLTSKEIELPEPKTYIVNIPCTDGSLDLSTALTGGTVNYENRNVTMKFTLLQSIGNWETIKSTIANFLHGKVMNVRFDADSNHYYVGRCTITEFKTDTIPATMTITMDAEPYKFNVSETTISKTFSRTQVITVDEQKMKVVPTITASANMTLIYKTKEYSILSGENIIPDVQLSSGDNNILTFNGSGTVNIKFRGGEL